MSSPNDSEPNTDEVLHSVLRTLCHDLRSPLTAVMTNLEFARRQLRSTTRDAELLESLDDSVLSCDALRRMVSNLDVLARRHEMSATLEYHSLGDILTNLVRRCREHAALCEMTLDEQNDHNDTRVFVDRRLLSLATENLLANAVQHGPRGSVVRLLLTKSDDTVSIHVEDEGEPIEAHDREDATSLEGQTQGGRRDGTRYSNGLALFAAKTAASIAGVTLEFRKTEGKNRMTLQVPTTPR